METQELKMILDALAGMGEGAKDAFLLYLGYDIGKILVGWGGGLLLAWIVAGKVVSVISSGTTAIQCMKQLRSDFIGRVPSPNYLSDSECEEVLNKVREMRLRDKERGE